MHADAHHELDGFVHSGAHHPFALPDDDDHEAEDVLVYGSPRAPGPAAPPRHVVGSWRNPLMPQPARKRQCTGLMSTQPSSRLYKLLLPVALAGGEAAKRQWETKRSEQPPNQLDDVGFWKVRPTSQTMECQQAHV